MRRRRRVRILLAGCLLVVLAGTGWTQEDSGRTVAPNAEPYEEGEFPQWARSLRRAEVIGLGTLPITLLASRILYGIGRFAVVSIAQGGFAVGYLPPVVAPPNAVPLSREDNVRIVIGAVTLSSTVALIDYLLGQSELDDE